MKKKLSPKRRAFVREYLKDGNGSKAAQRAGYAKNSARITACELLREPEVKKVLEEKLQKADEKAIVNKAYVLTNLKEVTERCMQHTPVMEFDHLVRQTVQKQTVDPVTGKLVGVYEFDSSGANRSLELLGKSMKMFTEKLEVEVTDSLAERMKRARERTAKK